MANLNAIFRLVDKTNEWVGKIISFSMLLVFALVLNEVIRRYLFNSPTVWGNESIQMIFGIYIMLSGGYILRFREHVNVDILYSRLSIKNKARLGIITFPIFLMFCSMLLIYGGSLAWESLSILEHSESAWNPPLYPVKMMIPVGASLILLQGIVKLIRDILILFTGENISQDISEKETL